MKNKINKILKINDEIVLIETNNKRITLKLNNDKNSFNFIFLKKISFEDIEIIIEKKRQINELF